ncbi:calexcitin-2-like [Epargyreus clarus]|uniref:calexcitin-2-like n=1 Tax=Epargyreus clarus TaxID=520877 RepID=UPI003C2ECF77
MGSEFRRKKVVHLFQTFFDKDKSNFIEKKDFELCAQYTVKHRGWQPGDAKYKETEDAMMKIWDSLQKHADKDNDGKVSLDEWVAMWDAYAKNPSAPLEWQNLYCKFIFEIEDATGDGAIDANEFASVFESFGKDKNDATAAFQKMAKGKPTVSWDEFQELWKEFFITEDPNAPGNFVFGSISF